MLALLYFGREEVGYDFAIQIIFLCRFSDRSRNEGWQAILDRGWMFFRFGFSVRQYRYLHVLSQWDSDVLTVMPSVIVLRVAAQRPAPSGFSRA